MEINEIKIGDLIWYNDGIPCKIQEVYQDGVAIAPSKIKASYDDIDPIPLDNNILEKNGWKKYYENEWTNPNFANLHASFINEGEWVMTVRSGETVDNILTDIKYVHELQHILWALGEEDDLSI